jgi:small subunit ribosomal protein S15
MLDPKLKQRVIKKFRTHDTDTGSAQIQSAILTEEIRLLTEHLKEHKKDFSSRRGLIKKVNERRRMLNYLRANDYDAYVQTCKRLKLKYAPPHVTEDPTPEQLEEAGL